MSMRGRSTHPQETITTINRSPLRRSKWDSRLDSAQGALHSHLNPLPGKGVPESLHVCCDSLILAQLARLASLRLVLQSLIGKEQLLPGGENKFFIAVYAP